MNLTRTTVPNTTEADTLTNLLDGDGAFLVLQNQVGEFSFWPAHLTVPAGWEVVLGASDRTEVERFVRARWTTLVPAERVRAHGMDVRG